MLKQVIVLSALLALAACGGSSDAGVSDATTGGTESPVSHGDEAADPEEPIASVEAESVPPLLGSSDEMTPPGVPALGI